MGRRGRFGPLLVPPSYGFLYDVFRIEVVEEMTEPRPRPPFPRRRTTRQPPGPGDVRLLPTLNSHSPPVFHKQEWKQVRCRKLHSTQLSPPATYLRRSPPVHNKRQTVPQPKPHHDPYRPTYPCPRGRPQAQTSPLSRRQPHTNLNEPKLY